MNVDEHSYISVSMDGSGSLDMCVRCEEDEKLEEMRLWALGAGIDNRDGCIHQVLNTLYRYRVFS